MSDSAIVWFVNVLMQATLVAAVAIVLGSCFRRSSAARYGVLCSGLLLMLFCPLNVLCLQSASVGLLTLSVEKAGDPRETSNDSSQSSQGDFLAIQADTVGSRDRLATEPETPERLSTSQRDMLHPGLSVGNELFQDQLSEQPKLIDNKSNRLSDKPSVLKRTSRIVATALIFVWCSVSTLMLVRFVVGWLRVLRLLHDSRLNNDSMLTEAFREACSALNVPDHIAQLRVSSQLTGPIAAGLWHPTVVLPESLKSEISNEQLHQVLVHEIAHIVRHDQIVVLLQNIANAVFWLVPLARLLNRQLTQAREEVCDNYVLLASDAISYSRMLLNVAQLASSHRPLPGTVGLFASHWKLESRVAGLLDARRNRITKLTKRDILMVGLMAAASVGVTSLTNITLAVAQTANTVEQQKQKSSSAVAGVVVDVAGKPVAGAMVAAIAAKQTWQTLAEGFADEQGRFSLDLQDATSATHDDSLVIARAKDSAIAWQDIDLDKRRSDVKLTLQTPQSIQVRLVDIEGLPLHDLAVSISSIEPVGGYGAASRGFGFNLKEAPRTTVLPLLRTDETGLLSLQCVPPEHGVSLRVTGDDRIAPQLLSLNSGQPEERPERDATYRELVKNLQPGEIATLPMSPARFFSGHVMMGDSDQPAANARIRIGASQQTPIGSSVWLDGETDAAGSFRICPYPGVSFEMIAYAPTGTPYHNKYLKNLKWEPGPATEDLEIRLPKGVLVNGTIRDAMTKQPLAGASVQYLPHDRNEYVNDDIVTGWQSLRHTGTDGSFSITTPPGKGTLLVHAPRATNYVLKMRGSREISLGQPGGERNYAHAFTSIDLAPDSKLAPLSIELQRGAETVATVVDPAGQPVDGFSLLSRLRILDHSPRWRGFTEQVVGAEVTIRGLPSGEAIPVYFFHPERRLGTRAMIDANATHVVVQLQPCDAATSRFVDQEGNPFANEGVSLFMVVTPGPSRWANNVENTELFSDEDFLSNIDRRNHWNLKTNDNGEVLFPALIPDATYRIPHSDIDGKTTVTEFTVSAGETKDLGEITIN